MNSMEKYQKMLSLEPYNDRTEIPVFPLMITSLPALAGVKQVDAFNNQDVWLQSALKTFELVGQPDVMAGAYPKDVVFCMYLPARVPGRDIGDDMLYQFVETPYFDDPAEYEKIMQMGWDNWFNMYTMSVQNPPFTSPEQLGARYMEFGQNLARSFEFIYGHGMVPWFDNGYYPIFDTLSMVRSMADFLYDFIDDPGPIMDIIDTYAGPQAEGIIGMLKANGGWRVDCFAMRSSATFISPSMWEEYVWPALKKQFLMFHDAGIHVQLHADANWLPMLPSLTELPKGTVHVELDDATDIEAAYEILKGSQSIQGNVPATMLMMDEPEDVSAYCEKLINMGMGGGFMLASGCEVPMNAKPENVKALISSVR